MFRTSRVFHRWVGVLCAASLVIIAATGLLLALKRKFDWIQPVSQKGPKLERAAQVVPIERIADAVFAQNLPDLRSLQDVDRFELHASRGIFKVTSKKNYVEVQVDATSAKVLSVARRNDQLIENIHDMSFFHPALRDWLLPVIGVGLFMLGLSGVFMFFVPVVRRWRYRRGLPPA
jgi:uncharacterized iron-regulated membrane protein